MLHIQTPLYRYQNLEKIYDSIPKHEDIRWHISKIKSRETPKSKVWDDPRVILHDIDCEDTDTVAKRNVAFKEMKDGWFHLLDDDTIFYPNMYDEYLKVKDSDFKGMCVGIQLTAQGRLRLSARAPRCNYIDTGNVLCHTSILEKVQWQKSDKYPRDYFFWKNCYDVLGDDGLKLIYKAISQYNVLRP